MLQNIRDLYGKKLSASDGEIGRVKDFYFDDKSWVIRYLVADTGPWLTGRQVLLSPHSFGQFDPVAKTLHVSLTRQQIENSPSIESHQPVSRQYEIEYYRYYGWPAYWDGNALWGFGGYPGAMPPTRDAIEIGRPMQHREDKHLQSTQAVAGYQLQTADGTLGRVTGFMADDRTWAIRDLVIEAGHWYAGKEFMAPAKKVERISYQESTVVVRLTKAEIEKPMGLR
jgi:hypothetical protein